MNPTNKAIAIVASIVIIFVCIIYAFVQGGPGLSLGNKNIDETKTGELGANDSLKIDSAFSGVNVTTDAGASNVTAHLYGAIFGLNLGDDSVLEITRSGNTLTVNAGKGWGGHINWNNNMKLDIVIPSEFSGDFDCGSSAGAVSINSDMTVKTFRAHSSAGPVHTQNVTAADRVEISSSAGEVNTQAVVADSADINSSAGRVQVGSCSAKTVRLHASAGSISAGGLSGKLDISSSAGSVDVELKDILDSADISSSAGSVKVSLPADASADLVAYSSAGSVSTGNLKFTSVSMQKKDRVEGMLGDGGARVTVHSSAGSVSVNGN